MTTGSDAYDLKHNMIKKHIKPVTYIYMQVTIVINIQENQQKLKDMKEVKKYLEDKG